VIQHGWPEAGHTFRERIEVMLKDARPEWDQAEAELDFWRAQGKERKSGIEVDDPAGEGEGTGSFTLSNCEVLLKGPVIISLADVLT
jgi:hypothetical protein